MSSVYIFDASAIIACLKEEPGGQKIEMLLQEPESTALITTINLSEVIQKLVAKGATFEQAVQAVDMLGLSSLPVTEEIALHAAQIYPDTRIAYASLADRICLAAAIQMRAHAVTADRVWGELVIPQLQVLRIR